MGVYFLAKSLDIFLLVVAAIVSLADALAEPAATIIIGRVFKELARLGNDKIASDEFMTKIGQYALALSLIGVYSMLCGWASYVLWVHLGYRQGHHARSLLFNAVISKSTSWLDSYDGNIAGITQMHFKDIQDLECAAGITACEIVFTGIGFIAEIIVAFYFSWAVTLVCLAGLPVLFLIGGLLSPPVSRLISESKSQLDSLSERANWTLRALSTVKVFQREQYEFNDFSNGLQSHQKITIKYWLLFFLQLGLSRSIALLIFVQGFYFGSYMVRRHGLDPGSVVTVFWACLSAAGMLQILMQHVLDWQRGQVSSQRLSAALDIDDDSELRASIGLFPNEPTTGNIKFHNVVFSYPSRPELVLADTTLEFRGGELTYVVGESGCGKSTIAAILTRQYLVDAGEVAIDDHSLDLLSRQWIEENIHVVDQSPKLFDIPLKDNIAIGSRSPGSVLLSEIEDACRVACADRFIDRLPSRLETPGSYCFSGGQQQRICVARARICNAPIMIFDETTSAMDAPLAREVLHNISQWRRGKTTIVVTHDLSLIPHGSTVYLMANGEAWRYEDVSHVPTYYAQEEEMEFESPFNDSSPELPSYESSVEKAERITIRASAVDHRTERSASEIKYTGTSKQLFLSQPNKTLLTLGAFITVIHAALNPVFAFMFSKLLMGILDPDAGKITLWAMMVLMCALLDGIVSTCKAVLNIATEQWQTHIRFSLFSRLLEQRYIEKHRVSYYTKLLMSDIDKCARIVTEYWPGVLNMMVLGVAGFVWSLKEGWRLSLVGLAIVPGFVVANQLNKLVSQFWMRQREARRSHVIRLLEDVTSGFRSVKVMRLERFFGEFYTKREKELHSLSTKIPLWVGLGYGGVKIFPYILESLVLWFGMRLVAHGDYTVQQTMTVFSLLMFTMVTIDQATAAIPAVGVGFEAIGRLFSALNALTPENQSGYTGPDLDWGEIEFVEVGVEYENGTRVLGNFSAVIPSGSCVALVGPSGIGKSSLSRMLERFETPSVGHILIGGRDLQTLSVTSVRSHIAMVAQMPLDFFNGTIMDNLVYALPSGIPRHIAEIKARAVCYDCGVYDFVKELADQYDTRIQNGLLSGGQMQRLGIARALLRSPKTLILDEATSALDAYSKSVVLDTIKRLHATSGTTIILITHQHDVAAFADYTITLA